MAPRCWPVGEVPAGLRGRSASHVWCAADPPSRLGVCLPVTAGRSGHRPSPGTRCAPASVSLWKCRGAVRGATPCSDRPRGGAYANIGPQVPEPHGTPLLVGFWVFQLKKEAIIHQHAFSQAGELLWADLLDFPY